MTVELPAEIRAFIDTTNAADTDGFVAAFTSDAYLNDWGRAFHGHEGVRSWDGSDNIGKRSHFELLDVVVGDKPNSYAVTLTVSGDGFNGAANMAFELRDGLISSLVIS